MTPEWFDIVSGIVTKQNHPPREEDPPQRRPQVPPNPSHQERLQNHQRNRLPSLPRRLPCHMHFSLPMSRSPPSTPASSGSPIILGQARFANCKHVACSHCKKDGITWGKHWYCINCDNPYYL